MNLLNIDYKIITCILNLIFTRNNTKLTGFNNNVNAVRVRIIFIKIQFHQNFCGITHFIVVTTRYTYELNLRHSDKLHLM